MKVKRKIVSVTARDIERGQGAEGKDGPCFETCAIARALQRLFKNPKANWAYRYGDVGNVRWFAVESERTYSFVIDHDQNKQVRPFRFTIEVRP